jgi:hypothetical protein
MSQENVEAVRRYYEVFSTWLKAYWADPGPLEETPGSLEVFNRLDPKAEWDWLLSSKIFRGRDQLVQRWPTGSRPWTTGGSRSGS